MGMTTTPSAPTCFIAMPITVHENEEALYGDPEHWAHVMNHLFIPAIEQAGFRSIVPSAKGTSMIHGQIVQNLTEADLVLCDLSQHNPNVLFELGVRTSLNKPVALVKDAHLGLPFDIQGLNTHHYDASLSPWLLESQVELLSAHIADTVAVSQNINPLWKHFGVAISATSPASDGDPLDAKLQLILERLDHVERPIVVDLDRAYERPRDSFSREVRIANIASTLPFSTKGITTQNSIRGDLLMKIRTPPTDAREQRANVNLAVNLFAAHGFTAMVEHSSSDLIALMILADQQDDSQTLSE